MAKRSVKYVSLTVLAFAAGLAGHVPQASAEQYLFDMLFGNRSNRQPVRQAPVVREPERPAPRAAAPKVNGPSYYNYRAEDLRKLDVTAIAPKAEEGAQFPPDSRFTRALAAAGDLDILAEKPIVDAITAYYQENPAFIWSDENGPNERALAALGVLRAANEDGLVEADYAVREPSASGDEDARLADLMRFELMLSARALRYARDATRGRVDPNKLSGYHDFPEKPFDAGRVLNILSQTANAPRYLASLQPANEIYAALRKELAALRASQEREIVVDPDTFVRPGGSHPDFAKLLRIIDRDADDAFRREHGVLLASYAGSETYADELVPVIKAAQKRHDLNPDGIVGRRTVGALAGESKAARIDKVILAMERLRWHPSHLGSRRVMINAASFTASYMEDGKEKLSMRTVVGKTANQTSFFYDEIEYVEFNPYWGVPRSILINEMLPRLRNDPGYLDRAGYEVTDAKGRRIPSSAINWSRYGANIPYNVRQTPSERNALGELKIMFPNKHAIYMHDTPARNLFSRDTRAFSHGCVRLHEPRAMAAAVLGTTEEDVGAAVARGKNSRRNVPLKIPVYVGYFTAWPDASGSVAYHDDVYDRDARLSTALTKVGDARLAGS